MGKSGHSEFHGNDGVGAIFVTSSAAHLNSFAEQNLPFLLASTVVLGLILTEKDGAVIISSQRWISWKFIYDFLHHFYGTLHCPSLSVGLVHYIKQNSV